MPTPAPRDPAKNDSPHPEERPRGAPRRTRAGAAALAFLCLALSAAPTLGAPVRLTSDADYVAFAARMKAYASASRVHWTVSAKSRGEANASIARLGLQFDPSDRFLLARASASAFEETPGLEGAASGPVASMAPQIGQSAPAAGCSWQVWVTDPDFPSASEAPVSVPLVPYDRLPVTAAATFRVGHTGLLQSHLYAFDETKPGALRDLATVNNINIPVAGGADNETILLASSRGPAPYFEGVKKALAASPGERRDLGKQLALRDNLVGTGRGIGANIQPVGPNMVVAKNDPAAKPPAASAEPSAEGQSGALIETCQYTLTPSVNVSQ